jgi:glucosamine-6-phosphate deaminase
LRPLAEGRKPAAPWRESLVIETTFDGGRGHDTAGRVLRTRQHKYVVYDRGRYREQLFDMEKDAGETVNLAVETRHQALLNDCRQRLAAALRETNDPFKIPAPEQGQGLNAQH